MGCVGQGRHSRDTTTIGDRTSRLWSSSLLPKEGTLYMRKVIIEFLAFCVTPIVLPDGRKAAIAHMELNIAYLKSIMKNILQEEVEEGFVMYKDGNIIVST